MFRFFKKNKPEVAYIITNDGNISLTYNGRAHSIGKSHEYYDAIVEVLNANKNFHLLEHLLDVPETIKKNVTGVSVNQFGEIVYNGNILHNSVSRRIMDFIQKGLPYKPLITFLDNLMQNPSKRAVDELYNFLSHNGLPITSDGCFMAYKGLTSDFKDRHTQTFDNSVGAIHRMARNMVDEDKDRTCSYGFHVGTHAYATDFAGSEGKVVLVKVNPRDAVSVPADHNDQKLRVCEYEVVQECEGLLDSPLYTVSKLTVEPATGRTRGPGGRFLPS